MAQDNAIGIRLSENNGFGAEASYQRDLSKKGRLEANLGFKNYGNGRYSGYNYGLNEFKLTGFYHWTFDIKDGFRWFVGPGGGVGAWRVNYDDSSFKDQNGTYFILAGNGGVEYNFDFPLRVAVDFRPEVYIGSDYVDINDRNFGPNVGISARYRF